MNGLVKLSTIDPSSPSSFTKKLIVDEVKQKRLQKMYEEYYKHYNKLIRPQQESKPLPPVRGLIKWNE